MSVFQTEVTVSRRYYERKSRADIVMAICDLHKLVPEPRPHIPDPKDLKKKSRSELASIAMELHGLLPDEEETS